MFRYTGYETCTSQLLDLEEETSKLGMEINK